MQAGCCRVGLCVFKLETCLLGTPHCQAISSDESFKLALCYFMSEKFQHFYNTQVFILSLISAIIENITVKELLKKLFLMHLLDEQLVIMRKGQPIPPLPNSVVQYKNQK